jgi:hypothetical protein
MERGRGPAKANNQCVKIKERGGHRLIEGLPEMRLKKSWK